MDDNTHNVCIGLIILTIILAIIYAIYSYNINCDKAYIQAGLVQKQIETVVRHDVIWVKP